MPKEAEQAKAQMAADNPMLRLGTPSEVAKAVAFLAFEATFTTGAELAVDGGGSRLRPSGLYGTGFVRVFITGASVARKPGLSAFVADGANRWPALVSPRRQRQRVPLRRRPSRLVGLELLWRRRAATQLII